MRADLHLHSYYSDGLVSPAYIAETCKKNGVIFASLTDHDNAYGTAEFAEECKKQGVKCVAGIEVSAYKNDVKIHTLGYNMDLSHPAYKQFEKYIYSGSEERIGEVLFKLGREGIDISMGDVCAQRRCEKSPFHIMYVAFAAAKKGYAAKAGDFYIKYLAPGKVAYSGRCRPTPEYALEVIKKSGGISSLAHPGRITLNGDEKIKLIQLMKSCGLDGIEAVYSGHTMGETAYYKEIAAKYSLLVTGGSDTHYSTGNREIGTPEFYPSQELLSALGIN
ncbi:MAG: PHP domain-containing protein [Clostridia bacterium]|nr:PHP domain-containing protein [Clostridia bacterium]